MLCIRSAMATWSKVLPFVLLGLRAEAVFGAPIVLPNEFLQGKEISVDSIIKIFSKTLDVPTFSLSRHNSSTHLPL
jgi:hypothetical protein